MSRKAILPRYRGAVLKRSNQQIVTRYGNLVKFAVGKYVRSFGLTYEQGEELIQSLLAELFKAPIAYRNYKGISLMIKHRLPWLIRCCIKHEEVLPLAEVEAPTREMSLAGLDTNILLRHLNSLPAAERTVIALSFGVDGCESFPIERIAAKLGRPESWVTRKRDSALVHLRASLTRSSPA